MNGKNDYNLYYRSFTLNTIVNNIIDSNSTCAVAMVPKPWLFFVDFAETHLLSAV